MAEANLMVVGTLIVLGGLIALPYGDAVLKLFLIVVGTLFLAFGGVQAVRRRRPAKGR